MPLFAVTMANRQHNVRDDDDDDDLEDADDAEDGEPIELPCCDGLFHYLFAPCFALHAVIKNKMKEPWDEDPKDGSSAKRYSWM
eukprot:3817730-Rhodomonas_salina.1